MQPKENFDCPVAPLDFCEERLAEAVARIMGAPVVELLDRSPEVTDSNNEIEG